MEINWKTRVKNPDFWLSAIPAVLLLIQSAAALFGFTLDLSDIGDKLLQVVNAAFGVLVLMGIVNDPTTKGMHDSARAMTYDAPWCDQKEDAQG